MNLIVFAVIVVVYILFVAIIAYAKGVHDAAQFRLRQKENKRDQMLVHVYGSLLVLIPIAVLSVAFWGFSLLTIKFVLVALALYFILFELTLNKLRGLPLLEVGQTWWFDVQVRKWANKTECDEERLMLAIKLLILIICLAI